MTIKKNVVLTVLTAVASQLSSILAAILLPRLLITYFGSELNGVVSTARQFSTYLSMIDSGMYAATCYRFIIAFKSNDVNAVNNLFTTVGNFFRRVSYIVIAAIVLCGIGYAMLVSSGADVFLVWYIFVAYSLGTAVAFYGYFRYNIVLFSAGKQYIITAVCAISGLMTVILQFVAIKLGLGIYIAVAVHPVLLVLRLILLKKFTLKDHPYLNSKTGTVDNSLIDKKWDSIILNIADSMKTFSPILSISVFFGAAYVSVYAIYESVLHLGSSIIIMCLNGLTPSLGKNLVECTDESKKQFRYLCSVVYLISGIICTCFCCMIMNFMSLYIGDKADMNYMYPLLAFFMIVNVWLLMVRTGYDLLMKSVGHISELRKGAVVEICISVVMSLLFAVVLGFEYVIIGVILSSAYRTFRMAKYCMKNLGYGRFVISDLLVWLVVTVSISAGFAYFAPYTGNWLTFIMGCIVIFVIALVIYLLFGVIYVNELRTKFNSLISRR